MARRDHYAAKANACNVLIRHKLYRISLEPDRFGKNAVVCVNLDVADITDIACNACRLHHHTDDFFNLSIMRI